MKKLFLCLMALCLLASCACAQEIELPYAQFVPVSNGDWIDFNEDGVPEEIRYWSDESRYGDYSIQVGDSLPVDTEDVYRSVSPYIGGADDMQVYALRLDDRTFLIVCGYSDDALVLYDIFQVIETEYITPYNYEGRNVVVAQVNTPIYDLIDDTEEIGSLEAGDYAFCSNDDWCDDNGDPWYEIEIADDTWGSVAGKDVQRMCRMDYFGAWTVRYVGMIQCYGEPESLRVEDGQVISNYGWINGLGSTQMIRKEFYLYCKDWQGWDWERDNHFIGGVFEMEPGCYATQPEVFARVEKELPLYTSRTSDDIGDVLQPGDVVLSYLTDGNGRFYLQEYKEEPWYGDLKSGWIELDENNNIVLPNEIIEPGYYGNTREYLTGLIYGG